MLVPIKVHIFYKDNVWYLARILRPSYTNLLLILRVNVCRKNKHGAIMRHQSQIPVLTLPKLLRIRNLRRNQKQQCHWYVILGKFTVRVCSIMC